jgi:DNA-binding LytR/AlgR family response regulator
VEAFENEAVDYLLKPVEPDRLQETVRRLKKRLDDPLPDSGVLPGILEKLLERLDGTGPRPGEFVKWISVQSGESIRLIPTDDILYFKATDKYTLVVTATGEFLITRTIRQLIQELDPDTFWQVHRGAIVNLGHVDRISRSLTGRYVVRLNGSADLLTVSRTYAHRFRQM